MVSLPPGSRLGRYQMVEGIGRGGMASVFKARDPQLERYVAVKVIPSYHTEDPTFIERFRQEAQAVARLNHPHIVQVHDFGEDKGFSYIVMELLTGGTLLEGMGEKVPFHQLLEQVSPIASALDYAHRQGIAHRDIKPSNVLLDEEGNPKLSDFGLARLMQQSAGLTRGPSVLGTPEYMAPEQALGKSADEKSDIYALGIMVYQMLLGRIPFQKETPLETLMAHIHEEVPTPTSLDADLDPRIESVLLRALAKEPGDRFPTAVAFAEALAPPGPKPAGDGEGPQGRDEEEEIESRPTVETPVPGSVEIDRPEDQESDSPVEVEAPTISLDQARVVAIRHARENTDFYGPRYSARELVWEVLTSEEGEDYYQIRLSFRPAGRFRGEPGVDLFTIDKTGSIELRQVLDEPVEKRRLAAPLIATIGLVVVIALVATLFAVGQFGGGSTPTPVTQGQVPARPTAAAAPPAQGAPPVGAAAVIPSPAAAAAVDTATDTPSPTATMEPRPTATPVPTPTAVLTTTATPAPPIKAESAALPEAPPEGFAQYLDPQHGFSFDYPDYLVPGPEGGGFIASFPTGGGLLLASGQVAVGLDLQKFVNLNIDTMKEIFAGFEVAALGHSTYSWSHTVLGVPVESVTAP